MYYSSTSSTSRVLVVVLVHEDLQVVLLVVLQVRKITKTGSASMATGSEPRGRAEFQLRVPSRINMLKVNSVAILSCFPVTVLPLTPTRT